MRKSLGVTAAAFAVTVLVGGSALAAPKGSNPFNGTYRGTTTVTGGSAPVFTTDSAGTLNANQLGNGTYTIDATQDWTTAPTSCSGAGAVVLGSATLYAANGASLTGTVAGTVCEVGNTDTTYASTLTMTITSGAGKFSGATGSIALNGTSTATSPTTFNDTATMVGTISK